MGWFLTEDSQGSQGANRGRSHAKHRGLETGGIQEQQGEMCRGTMCSGQRHALKFRAVYQGHREGSGCWTVLFVSLLLRPPPSVP